MKQNVNETVNLLRKALAGRLSDKERSRMDVLMQREALQNIYKELESDEQLARLMQRQSAFSPEEGYRRFCQRVEKGRTHSACGAGLQRLPLACWCL